MRPRDITPHYASTARSVRVVRPLVRPFSSCRVWGRRTRGEDVSRGAPFADPRSGRERRDWRAAGAVRGTTNSDAAGRQFSVVFATRSGSDPSVGHRQSVFIRVYPWPAFSRLSFFAPSPRDLEQP